MSMIGQTIGAYQIVAELGRGGMAVVYKAFQPSLNRYVALKVLPDYFQHDPEFVARFKQEAQAAAQLSHPNVVVIYDVGEDAGVHYIAMEYLEGENTDFDVGVVFHRSRENTQKIAGSIWEIPFVSDYSDVTGRCTEGATDTSFA